MDAFIVADATKLVVSQRLVRRLCPLCSAQTEPEGAKLDRAAEAVRRGGVDWHGLAKKFRKAVGCERCGRTGIRGRTVIAETLEVTADTGRAPRQNATAGELGRIVVGQGMTTLAAHGNRRAAAGETMIDEILCLIP